MVKSGKRSLRSTGERPASQGPGTSLTAGSGGVPRPSQERHSFAGRLFLARRLHFGEHDRDGAELIRCVPMPESGFDMTTPEGLAEFQATNNTRLLANQLERQQPK